MNIYHFLKYEKGFSFEDLAFKNKTGSVLCFDLEDSIQDIFNPENTTNLKAHFRKVFYSGYHAINTSFKNHIAIRINSVKSKEYVHDIELLTSLKYIHSIFLPKTNTPEDVKRLQSDLAINNISYSEIIPVVETKSGLLNIKAISKIDSERVKRIAFGHCDYNSDVGIFPFLHQNTREYWNWIEKFQENLQNSGIRFLNSPFLELTNDAGFEQMLSSLQSVFGNQFDQITLNYRQSESCNNFNGIANSGFRKITNRLIESDVLSYAKMFVSQFENHIQDKGFSFSANNNELLSPHEYHSALDFLHSNNQPEINFTFVGGCFPVQGGICYEDIFHQLIKNRLESRHAIKLNVTIIRYEQLSNCYDKIIYRHKINPLEILVFCFRAEPVLRLMKFTYKGIQNNGKVKRIINVPFLHNYSDSKNDLLPSDFISSRVYLPQNKKRHVFLKQLNYFLGKTIGNYNFAVKKYKILFNEINSFCIANNIKLILLGPALRNTSAMELNVSNKFASDIKKSFNTGNYNFINGSKTHQNGVALFHSNGIHANEIYHSMIAEMLIEKIEPEIIKIKLLKKMESELVFN